MQELFPKIAIFNRTFVEPTQVWIKRHVDGLSNYKPIVITQRLVAEVDNDIYVIGRNTLTRKIIGKLSQNFFRDFEYQTSKYDWYIFRKTLQKIDPVLIHVHFLWNAIFLLERGFKFDIPVIATAHGTDVNMARVNKEYLEKLHNVFLNIDKIICISEFIKRQLIDLGCPPKKLIVNYLGVPIEKKKFFREKNAIIQFVCVSALRPEKGYKYLLTSFSMLLKKMKNVRLLIIGDGSLRKILEEQAQELHIAPFVKFSGWLKSADVFEALKDSDIYLQHSIRYHQSSPQPVLKEEGLGISLVEAASLKLPLIATNVGGIPEICRHGINGFLTEEYDVEKMCEHMYLLASDEKLRADMGTRGRQIVLDNFNENEQLEKLENIYTQILKQIN